GRPGAQRHRLRRRGLHPAPAAHHRAQRHRRGAVLPRGAVCRDQEAHGRGDRRRLRPGHRRHGQPDAGLRRAAARRGGRAAAAGVRRDSGTDPDPPVVVAPDAARATARAV
ncbi:MAG: Integral membrane protein, partial [uncultured Nocardioides sp.]